MKQASVNFPVTNEPNLCLTLGLGKHIEVEHGGEKLLVGLTIIKGAQIRLVFRAPRSFTIKRKKNK